MKKEKEKKRGWDEVNEDGRRKEDEMRKERKIQH